MATEAVHDIEPRVVNFTAQKRQVHEGGKSNPCGGYIAYC